VTASFVRIASKLLFQENICNKARNIRELCPHHLKPPFSNKPYQVEIHKARARCGLDKEKELTMV